MGIKWSGTDNKSAVVVVGVGGAGEGAWASRVGPTRVHTGTGAHTHTCPGLFSAAARGKHSQCQLACRLGGGGGSMGPGPGGWAPPLKTCPGVLSPGRQRQHRAPPRSSRAEEPGGRVMVAVRCGRTVGGSCGAAAGGLQGADQTSQPQPLAVLLRRLLGAHDHQRQAVGVRLRHDGNYRVGGGQKERGSRARWAGGEGGSQGWGRQPAGAAGDSQHQQND